jgi:hypothetical protein
MANQGQALAVMAVIRQLEVTLEILLRHGADISNTDFGRSKAWCEVCRWTVFSVLFTSRRDYNLDSEEDCESNIWNGIRDWA